MKVENFKRFFGAEKVLIGMLHLAGETESEKLERAIEEAHILQEEGFNGLIVEDYHGDLEDVERVLERFGGEDLGIKIGINTLRDPYLGLKWASEYNGDFVQFDNVLSNSLLTGKYNVFRKEYSKPIVFGGVRFKYQEPTGNSLYEDIREGFSRCEVIVTTGEGTGIETPIEKLGRFREIIRDKTTFVVGAGVNKYNIREQMKIVDGAVIGSSLKEGRNTLNKIERKCVKKLVSLVK